MQARGLDAVVGQVGEVLFEKRPAPRASRPERSAQDGASVQGNHPCVCSGFKCARPATYASELYERHEKSDGSAEHLLRVSAGGRTVAEVAFKAASAGATPARSERYLHPDHLGSPDVLTGGDGRLIERRSYAPFGQRRPADWSNHGPAPAPLTTGEGFTGHEEDDELGLVYMKGRTYDPKLGRFLQKDALVPAPVFSQSWNPYAYVLNNPLTLVDPSGFEPQSDGQGHQCAQVMGSDCVWFDSSGGFHVTDLSTGDTWSAAEVIITPTGVTVVKGPPPGHGFAEGTWGWQRGGGAPQAGRESAEGLGGSGAPSGGRRPPANPHDISYRLAVGVTDAIDQRLDELPRELAEDVLFLENFVGAVGAAKLGMTVLATLGKGLATNLGKTMAKQVASSACFAAGTEVWTADGLVPIEQVAPGQLVLSRDETTGELGWKRVVRTFVTPGQETLALSLADDERGEHETVEATAEHPFWLEGRGWVDAGSLVPGQRVVRADGRWLRVERVEVRPGRRTVYNLEVEDWHTYVVGSLGAWVHNACDPKDVIRKGIDIVGKAGHAGPQPTQLEIHPGIVESYAALLRDGKNVGKIHVSELPDGRKFITEGHHRYVASQKTGVHVEIDVRPDGGPVGFDWSQVVYNAFHVD